MASESHHAHAHGEGHGSDAHDDGNVHVHIATTGFYVGIFAALVVLTILTVKVSYYDFGALNTVVAVLIATMKASLVAVFFMHLRHDSLFNALSFIGAFFFLAIFILLTYDDVGHRAELDNDYGGTVQVRTGQAAPGGMPATTSTANEAEDEPPSAGSSPKKE